MRGAVIAVVCAVVVMVIFAVAGFGTRSQLYATPWTDPLRYIANLATLFTAGSWRLAAPLSLDLLLYYPAARIPLVVVGAAFVWPLAIVIGRRLRLHPETPFLALWLVVSLLAEGAAPAWDRLLFQDAVGSSALLALFVCSVLRSSHDTEPTHRRHFAWVVVIVTGGLSLLSAIAHSAAVATVVRDTRETVFSADPGPRRRSEMNSNHGLFSAEVVAADATEPRALRLHLRISLDASNLLLLAPVDGRLAPVQVPAPGEALSLLEVEFDSSLCP